MTRKQEPSARIAEHAIITGGSSGIGLKIAVLMAQRGANITLMARRPDLLASARDTVQAAKRSPEQKILTVPVDVADKAAVDAAFAKAVAENGPCDFLVTSAGVSRPGYFDELPTEAFATSMQVNYFGTLYAIQAVVPGMRKLGRGRIVLISSGAGIIGVFGYTTYCPTKFALQGLAESIRPELVRSGIGVSIVCPPDTDTPMLKEEAKTKPPETEAIAAAAKVWSAEGVAKATLDGVDAGRFVITPGLELTWIFRLRGLFLTQLNHRMDAVAAKAAKAAAAKAAKAATVDANTKHR